MIQTKTTMLLNTKQITEQIQTDLLNNSKHTFCLYTYVSLQGQMPTTEMTKQFETVLRQVLSAHGFYISEVMERMPPVYEVKPNPKLLCSLNTQEVSNKIAALLKQGQTEFSIFTCAEFPNGQKPTNEMAKDFERILEDTCVRNDFHIARVRESFPAGYTVAKTDSKVQAFVNRFLNILK